MKILVQHYSNNLSWKEAIYKGGHFRSPDERICYDELSIYAVKDDNRNQTVICSACGREIANNPSAIRAHRNMVHKSNKCFECYYLKPRNEKITSQKYVMNADGTYAESTKRTVNLTCSVGYRYYDINSSEAQATCRYARCETATFKNIEDFWTKYPDAFDEFITVDKLIEAGYKSMYRCSDYMTFELKGKTNLDAYVNNQGVCLYFNLRYRRKYYKLRYSKKYDKVWVLNYGTLRDLSVLDMSADTENAIIKKLKTLYN